MPLQKTKGYLYAVTNTRVKEKCEMGCDSREGSRLADRARPRDRVPLPKPRARGGYKYAKFPHLTVGE